MMSDTDIKSAVQRQIYQAVGHDSDEFKSFRQDMLRLYNGEKLGNEREGRSQVVLTEVRDTIEYAMPQLMDIFGTAEFTRFVPRGPEDIRAADQATTLVNWSFHSINPGFRILHDFMKDSLLFGMGVVKAYWQDNTKVMTEEYSGLTDDELAALLTNQNIEVLEQDVDDATDSAAYSVKLRVTVPDGTVVIENVPPEEFLFPPGTKSLETAQFICHRTIKTATELLDAGYDSDVVGRMAQASREADEEHQDRHTSIDGGDLNDPVDESMTPIEVAECYTYMDVDGDGRAELRRIVMIGNSEIVENDPWDVLPFAVLSPILMPHRMVGQGLAEMVADIQTMKTTLFRNVLDNVYATNNYRVQAVEGQVNLDDLLDNRPNSVVRVRAPGMVQNMPVGQLPPQAYNMLGYLDEIRDQRSGFSKASMGLDPDALQSTTAAAVNATIQAGQAKVMMIARTFAETGIKDLAKLLLHLCTKHLTGPQVVRINGGFEMIDPAEISGDYDVEATVGLGTGRQDQKLVTLNQILAKQEQILQQFGLDNGVVTLESYVRTLQKITEMGGLKNSADYFAWNDQIAEMIAQRSAESQDDQTSPEIIKIQQDMQIEREKIQLEQEIEREKAQMEIDLEREKLAATLAIRREEMAMEAQLREQALLAGDNVSTNLPRA